jgi:hypothetical protein
MVKLTLKSFIKNAESISLSDSDILTALDGKCSLMAYEDLEHYSDIESVLGEHGACVILYQTSSDTNGHWISLFKHPTKQDTLIFFDSYGFPIDSELKLSKFNLRVHNGEVVPHLTHLIEQSTYKVESNNFKYQSNRQNDNECGRYVIVRLLFRDLDIKQFHHFLSNGFEGLTYGDTVTLLTISFSLQN